jgi:hypothetical protein
MNRLAFRSLSWWRTILALGGMTSVALGVVLFPAAPSSLALTHHGGSKGSAVTVTGPRMLNPASINPGNGDAKLFKYHSKVSVTQTTNLTDQTVQVSWSGFSPSGEQLPYQSTNTSYPVVVAQCNTAHPRYQDQCYGVSGRIGTQGGVSKYGPYNAVYTTTTSRGTGEADIPLLTGLQNQWLNCSPTHACSLAIIPVQGGNILETPYSCTNHLEDALVEGNTEAASVAFNNPPGPLCSWDKRIVIPLHFAPSIDDCKFSNPDFTVLGSPMSQRAMDQWDSGLCETRNPLYITYGAALAEPAAVQAVQAGGGDVALTTQPAASLTGSKHKYTYAPVTVTATSIAYWVDNSNTAEPFTNLKLDPRLVLKMLTTSYDLSDIACTPHPSSVCDSGVDGNPEDILVDPEFTKLNPHINLNNTPLGSAVSPANVPIVASGPSDMTYAVTRWIAANKDASAFLADEPDQWGMRMNSYYHALKYPTNDFVPQDPTPQTSRSYSPVFPLYLAVDDMVEAWPPGTGYRKQVCGNPGSPEGYCRLTQETPGQRVLFGILDYGDTDAYLIPSAAILNPAGRYVQPSTRSMAAALNSMVTASNGITQQVSTTSKNKAEYPLTMVVYAMVPISGESHAKADDIARWLRFVAGSGQDEGTAPGQLPVGYLPLTSKLRAETLKAANEVQDQTGDTAKSSPSPSSSSTGSSSTSSSTSPSPGSSVSTSPSPGVSLPTVHPKIATVAVRDPQTSGLLRFALPVVLILGGLAALGGASTLLAPNSGAIAARLRHLYHNGGPWRKKP